MLKNSPDEKIKYFSKKVRNKTVLDLGVVQHTSENESRNTWLHKALKEEAKEILGGDIDNDGVKDLKIKGYSVITLDAQNFNLNKTFEVIVAGDLIEHLDNLSGFLSSVKKHLDEKNGIFLLSTPNPFWWKYFLLSAWYKKSRVHPQHTTWFCETTLKQLLERNGLVVADVHYETVYIFDTIGQKITYYVNNFLFFLPNITRHNTIMMVIKHS